jgi:Di-haem cytochrome c peroxidase
MTERRWIYIGLLGLVVALIGMAIPWYGRAAADVLGGPLPAPTLSSDIVQLTPVEKLGKLMLYDSTLSNPPGYSCATCHVPETGFTGPNSEINAFSGPQPGVVPGRFSNRKPQSYLYAAFSPVGPYYDSGLKTWLGGGFWNGRVPDLATQALQPPLNPNEMAKRSAKQRHPLSKSRAGPRSKQTGLRRWRIGSRNIRAFRSSTKWSSTRFSSDFIPRAELIPTPSPPMSSVACRKMAIAGQEAPPGTRCTPWGSLSLTGQPRKPTSTLQPTLS